MTAGANRLRPQIGSQLQNSGLPDRLGVSEAVDLFAGPHAVESGVPAPPIVMTQVDILTSREQEVLALIGAGLSNDEIAAELYVGAGTVKTHVGHIFTKLDLRDRAAVVISAFDHGIVQPGDSRRSDDSTSPGNEKPEHR